MASITINKFTGKGVTFAFAMVSSYTLAVVREGDLPVIIPPWTLKPVELPPYDPARPYFFLVQKPGEAVWRSLYFVKRDTYDGMVVVDMPGQPAPPLHVSTPTPCSGPTCTSTSSTSVALCPKDHFSRLFQMRSMQWYDYSDWGRPVETMTDGLFRCGGNCGDATRHPLSVFVLLSSYPGHNGYFHPVDNEYLCKVATDESIPAVFAVLPAVVTIPDDLKYKEDQTLPVSKYVEEYYITSTIDRCALIYYSNYDHGGSDPVLVPQLCATQMATGKDTNGINLIPLQATYDAGEFLCDAHIGDPGCASSPSRLSPTC
jgi:hypothetical protein